MRYNRWLFEKGRKFTKVKSWFIYYWKWNFNQIRRTKNHTSHTGFKVIRDILIMLKKNLHSLLSQKDYMQVNMGWQVMVESETQLSF